MINFRVNYEGNIFNMIIISSVKEEIFVTKKKLENLKFRMG